MIPIKLTLRNFMPYRENVPTLDFTGIHTATISGDNGAGKSSIIDAITWALWDKTRAKKEDDLIHIGQNEAQVEFEFSVSGQKYRVTRRRSRPKKQGGAGATQLHLFILDENGARSIDGDTITQTQLKIEQILHMDYETFTNSAYLRQGHADEFTTATPADRKKVLGNILGMEVYDRLERRARELASQRKTVKEQLQTVLADMDTELTRLPGYETEMAEAQNALNIIEASIKSADEKLNGLRVKKELLEAKKAQLSHLEQNILSARQQLAQLQPQITQLQARIKEHAAILVKSAEIEEGYQEFVEARQQVEVNNKNLGLVSRLNQKISEMEKIVEREKQALLREHALVENRVTELKKIAAAVPGLRESLKKVQSDLEATVKKDDDLRLKKQSMQELLAQIRSLEDDKTRLEREITGINEKLHLLKTQPGAAKCPMCGSELGENGFQHIANEYENDKIKKSDAVKSDLAAIKIRQGEVKTLSEETNIAERSLNQEKTQLQSSKAKLEAELTRAEEAGAGLGEELNKKQAIEELLMGKAFAVAQQQALGQLETELAKLDYNQAAHQAAQSLYNGLRQFEAPKRQLDEAAKLMPQEKENLAGLEKLAQDARSRLEDNERQKITLMPEVAAITSVSGELINMETEFKNLSQQQLQAKQKYGNIEQRILDLRQTAVKKKDRADQLIQVAKEEQIYLDLALAFGNKGVQNMLIETAVPEIENEANRLLSKMTDGRMNVKFETQRPNQKGILNETLDINISDDLGLRSYEMFSGGEAFRINFSIRIALSRLLARRAGAPLPTLIIDEGFGTQDAGGIEKLKEAIVSIQDDFEKILVITHIDELKDAFPARIDVTKTPDGSMISLS